MAVSKIIELIFRTKGAKKVAEQTKSVDSKLANLGKNAIKTGIALATINKAFGFIVKSAEKAGRLEGITQGFTNLTEKAGMGADVLNQLQQATDGTMSKMELMELANNALLLGIADSSDQMAEMFDIAQRLGKSLGKDTRFGVESLVTGMGRQSKLMLDNIGIMVNIEEANERYAKELGKTTKALTDQEKKLAFNNEVIRQGRDLVGQLGEESITAKDKMDQLAATSEDMSASLGTLFVPALEGVTKAMQKATLATFDFLIATNDSFKAADKQHEMTVAALALETETLERLARAMKTKNETGVESLKVADQINQLEDERTSVLLNQVEVHGKLAKGAGQNNEILKAQVPLIREVGGAWMSPEQEAGVKLTQMFATNLAEAVIHGQDLGAAMVSSLKAIAIEMAANAAMFMLLNTMTGGTFAASQAGAGGLTGFLLKGFTGQTPRVNNHVHISGGLISDSYVRNTLVPAMNRVRSFG